MKNVTSTQFERAAQLQREIEERQTEIDQIFGNGAVVSNIPTVNAPATSFSRGPKTRVMSAAAKLAISEAQKRRWAKVRREKKAALATKA
jgi:hypothetical protein